MDHCVERSQLLWSMRHRRLGSVRPQTGLPAAHAGLENIECVPSPKAGDRRGVAEQRLRHIQVRQPSGENSREFGKRSQRWGYSAAK